MASYRKRVARSAASMIAILGLLVGGCGLGSDPNEVSLAYYMRNLSEQDFEYEIASSEGVYGHGEVTKEPASTGCGAVPRDWELTVWPAGQIDGDREPAASLSAAQVGPLDPVMVWVNVNPAGQVQTGLGLPGWWMADIQRCP